MRRELPPPWAWTLLVSVLLAAAIATGGALLASRVERTVVHPPGNRVDDAFRGMIRQVDEMEELWQKGIEQDADALLTAGSREVSIATVGVVQYSRLNPSFSDAQRAHHRLDGQPPAIEPVLERFARGGAQEWVFKEGEIIRHRGWVEEAGRPLAWVKGNDRIAVVMILDPAAAAQTVALQLQAWAARNGPPDEGGGLVWTAPDGQVWQRSGEPAESPHEILRHVSRFGDWTLQRTYPVRSVTRYRPLVLGSGLALAALLVAGGGAVAWGQRKAFRVAEERVSFVNRVSHELRTPLTNLLLNTDLALDGLEQDSPRVRRRLGLIREETARLSRIVDNVLAFARIERGQGRPVVAPCDVGRLVTEVHENFAPLFERKSIVCNCEVRTPESLPVDRDALAQIAANLLSNVEKYAGESAQARILATVEGDRLVLEVGDDGPGIPAAQRERVFQPFERALSRVDEGASGTGLGLAISRELARRMGGQLALKPSARGAVFRLEIPLGEEKERSGA